MYSSRGKLVLVLLAAGLGSPPTRAVSYVGAKRPLFAKRYTGPLCDAFCASHSATSLPGNALHGGWVTADHIARVVVLREYVAAKQPGNLPCELSVLRIV